MKAYRVILSLTALWFLFGCSKENLNHIAEWNFMIYMAADNNLERYAIKNIESLQKIGSNQDINIFVLLDRSPGYDKSNDNWSDARLMHISHNPNQLNDDIIENWGELDMTSPNTLIRFLNHIEGRYPATHSLLTIWGHGRGVYPDGKIPYQKTKGVIEDYTTGYGSEKTMSISDFSSAINSFKKKFNKNIDIIHFDACSMQMIEICCQLKDCTDVIVGADTQVPGYGSDYEMIAQYLAITSYSLSSHISDYYISSQSKINSSYAYSAIRTDKVDSFLVNFDYFCKELRKKNDGQNPSLFDFRNLLTPIDHSYTEYVDLHEFIKMATNTYNIPSNQIIQSISDMIISSSHSSDLSDDIWGLGINYPQNKGTFDYYLSSDSSNFLDFYHSNNWTLFLVDYYNKFLII